MTHGLKIENWSYPFEGGASNPLDNLTVMARAKGGYYPIGGSGVWHGGVHFDSGTAAIFEQNSIRCIADGEVVAYRIDTRYPHTQYTHTRAPFSTGFVLVRHRLEVPSANGDTSGPALTFFSHYMHLRDWAAYEADDTLIHPFFWEGVKAYEVSTKDTALRVRRLPTANGLEVATLPKGTVVAVGVVEDDYHELLSVVSGNPSAALSPQSEENPRLGWIASKYLKPYGQPTPHSTDAVVVLPQPVRIKAGDVIGHVGMYQNASQGSPEALLHLEVFSCDDVPAFLAQSSAYGALLPEKQKTLLKVHKGAKLIPHQEGINADNPPHIGRWTEDLVVGAELMVPQSYLDNLPATHKFKVSTPLPGNLAREVHWWRLEGIVPDERGNAISGWFAEQDLLTTRHSPWEWEGFHCIEETGSYVEMTAYAFNAEGCLSANQQENFRAQINRAEEGPIVAIARLHDMIDTDKDGKLSKQEVRAALQKPWQSQVLAQVIARYESEWFWSSKWDEMDGLMEHSPSAPNPNWALEKIRIKGLSWWSDVVSVQGIAIDGNAWHINPLALIGAYQKKISHEVMLAGQITFDAEGSDNPQSPFYSRVIHWPGNDLSGVTLGRGYDMGSRSKAEVYNHLTLSGVTQVQAHKISLSAGLRGNQAKNFVITNKADCEEITRDQEIALFKLIYPDYLSRALNNYNYWTHGKAEKIEWQLLTQSIRDVLVDFVYQGFTKGGRPMEAGMKNNVQELISYIENTPGISRYEAGRQRANYLKRMQSE